MDILDNIMFATFHSPLTGGRPIQSDYVPNAAVPPIPVISPLVAAGAPVYAYPLAEKLIFCAFDDVARLERAILRHWYDIDNQAIYASQPPAANNQPAVQYSDFRFSSTYHLITAYLIENTRILQIFERVIERYLNDEELGIANAQVVFDWIYNSEKLFFKSDTPKATNLRSLIRPSSDSSRRNAYHRMFGMDLAFGSLEGQGNSALPYPKAKAANLQFVPLFERYLSEVWQGYINARNSSGPNTTDVNIMVELATQLQEMLAARRGNTTTNTYAHLNLSREEFSSVLITTWFAFVISYDSPVVNYLSCQSSTIGERLLKIGNKVGVPAHSKSQYLFEMAGAAGTILLAIEAGGLLDNTAWVQTMLSSLNPGILPSVQSGYMDAFLTVINNWERATGHKIKNPEARIKGPIRLEPTPAKAALLIK